MYDAIVIGAGPAGLQAALTLGRMHRPVLVLDSGEYRNATVPHMHNVIGNDGTPPHDFRSEARGQLAAYSDVELRDLGAQSISGSEGDFTVTLADGRTEQARAIILATGVTDDLPDVPGLTGLWGLTAFNCPFCDGHEHAGKTIGVLGAGPRAAHVISLLDRIVSRITVFPIGDPASADDRRMLEAQGVTVHPQPVTSVEASGDGVRILAGSESVEVAGIFVTEGQVRQRAPFAEHLGLRMLPSGAIEIDELGRTSLAGVSAGGDLAHRATLPGLMASVVQASAAGQMAAIGVIQSLLTSAH